jgi:serine/threonine protein kinase
MSPEQATNRELSGTTDQYSLGVVLYEMLVGRPPFTGPTAEVLAQHLRDPITLPPDVRMRVRADLVEVLETMVRKDPGRRYPTVRELAAQLDRALQRRRRRRLTTIPTPRPKLVPPGLLASGPRPQAAPPPDEFDAGMAPPPESRRSGARSGSRTAVDSHVGRSGARFNRPDDAAAFEGEGLPQPIRVGLVLLAFVAVGVIAFWAGRNESPPRPVASEGGYANGTVIGNVESKIYHIVGVTQSKLPSRMRSRVFKNVEEAESAGYRRSAQ